MRRLTLPPPYYVQLSAFGRLTVLLLLVLFLQKSIPASTIGFENLPSGTILTNQFSGATFFNAIVLTTGFTLDEFECPPHSGANVASDNGGQMTISFASPLRSISGYFTYSVPLTIQAFDSSNHPIGSAVSAFANNQALSGISGSQPGELLQIGAPTSIYTIAIAGAANGRSFTVDDITPIAKCDVNQDGVTNVADAQAIVNEALGATPIQAGDDMNADGAVNVADVGIVMNAAVGLACTAK